MIKQKILIFIIISLKVLPVLSQSNIKNINEDFSLDTGSVIFYSNAQALLNCGSFDIEIRINNEYAGIINKPYTNDFQPNCSNDSSLLLIKKNVGYYNYTANIKNCGQYGKWNGKFKIIKNSCTKIFLDIRNCNPKN